MYIHSYLFNPDVRLLVNLAASTISLINQAGIIIRTILNLWETTGIEQKGDIF